MSSELVFSELMLLVLQSVLMIDRCCAIKKGGRDRWAGIFKTCCAHEAALAGCRTALVGIRWIISHLASTNGHRKHSFPLVGVPFQICRQFSVGWSVLWSARPGR